MMRRINKKEAVSYAAGAAAGLMLGIALYLAVSAGLGKDPMPMPLGIGMGTVASGSMEPALSTGDLVIVKKAESYETGDIVVYISSGSLVVHRIVGIYEDSSTNTYDVQLSPEDKRRLDRGESVQESSISIVTKGDANNAEDTPVSISSVKGRVVYSVPGLGWLLQGFRSVPGVIILLLISIALTEIPMKRKKQDAAEMQEKIREEIRKLRAEMDAEQGREKDIEIRQAAAEEDANTVRQTAAEGSAKAAGQTAAEENSTQNQTAGNEDT